MDHTSGGLALLQKHLADARQRLIQTGTRNRLVHTPRFMRQGKSIDIVDERSEDAFQILFTDGRRMRFAHDPSVKEVQGSDEESLLPALQAPPDEGRFTDLVLQTKLGRERLQKRLLGLAREARTLEEEQGINALYLAMGFLRWFEDDRSEVERFAPLILLPASLRRNERTSTYDLEIRGEDITTNEPLKHRLAEAGIKLPEIPETEGWSPTSYFDAVAEAVSAMNRWSIDRDGMQLGFFSFAKLLMVRDLEPENWPNDEIIDHPIVAGLLTEGFASERDDFEATGDLDELFAPADLIQIVDADASQTLVIETVRKGRNLVVQGPPGTGKSQTITNIIAAAAYDGKSVLFVAEKMAALNVVHGRLRDHGLADVCLELHSRSANKRLVAEELGRTLSAASVPAQGSDVAELTRLRDRLNRVAGVMHRPVGETGVTPFRAISTLIRLNEQGFAPSDLIVPGIAAWTGERLDEALTAATALASLTSKAGPKLQHPFFGVRKTDILPTDQQRLQPKLEQLIKLLGAADRSAATVAQSLGVSGPRSAQTSGGIVGVIEHISTLGSSAVPFAAAIAQHGAVDRTRLLAEAGSKYVALRDAAGTIFSTAAIAAPVDHLRSMLASGHSIFGRLGRPYRAASAELASLVRGALPKAQPDRMALLDRLVELQQANAKFQTLQAAGSELLASLWQGENTDFTALGEATAWMSRLLQAAVALNATSAVNLRRYDPAQLQKLRDVVAAQSRGAEAIARDVLAALDLDIEQVFGVARAEEIPFDALLNWATRWNENLERLDEWTQLRAADERLRELAGEQVADALATGSIAPAQLRSTIRYIHAEQIYRQFAASEAWATSLTSAEKAELAATFAEREKTRRVTVARLIRDEHLNRLPRGGMGAMGVVRGEIGKRRGHKPIRRLISEAGGVIQQIKPVLLMSPISVAQYLAPGALEFDLLVIDEASQVRPEDALGAIARSKQIVVVGDKRQLPPTSFFDRVLSDLPDEEPEEDSDIPAPSVTGATELESILTLCEARGLASRMLRWHYRSRHPSLIEVSNQVFYSDNGGLILFPSPSATRETDGLTLTRVDGAYDRGGKRNNVREAEAVAQAVAVHAAKTPKRSLGVVTFSTAQRDAINERLDGLRLTDNALDAFMREGKTEEFFVKNIETVQGDERDVIFVSVGYGPRVAGTPLDSMAFGPVSSDGGERRLNVLFTRARYRTQVFVSFKSSDIDLDRSKSFGARVLKKFLYYAETGDNRPATILDNDPDSDFEVSVASEIRRLGYKVDYQVGSSGFKIDLAVRRPDQENRYMLAVECDGATYHSAVWARERDRLRQEVLEGLGWRFHRVWSTDWFHRRGDEVRRLEAALVAATNDLVVRAGDDEGEVEDDVVYEGDEDAAVATDEGPSLSDLPDYVVASFAVPKGIEPHEVPLATMSPIVQRIVEVEGPIHREEVARRVASLFGKQKAGSRIVAAVDRTLSHAARPGGTLSEQSGFWTAHGMANVPLRNRSRAPLNLRKASLLPPSEINEAIKRVLADNGALSWDDLPRAVAILFGFQRTGPEFRPAIVPVIEAMLVDGLLVEGPAGLELAKT